MYFSWPNVAYSLNDVIVGNVKLSEIDKESFIKAVRINYALDTLFIFSWIVSWAGLFLHFRSLNTKLIGVCFGLSLWGALLDITENSISFSLLMRNNTNAGNFLFTHSVIRDLSYWLPMIAAVVLALILPMQKRFSMVFLKLMGIVGVLFAILGMYIPFFSAIPFYWFGLWFLAAGIFLIDNYKNKQTV